MKDSFPSPDEDDNYEMTLIYRASARLNRRLRQTALFSDVVGWNIGTTMPFIIILSYCHLQVSKT